MLVDLPWSDFKSRVLNAKKVRYIDRDTFYTIRYQDEGGMFETSVLKDSGSDQTDFEANYKTAANTVLDPLAADGRPLVRQLPAESGRLYRLRPVSFYTADSTKTHNRQPDGTDYGDLTYTMFDAADAVTTVTTEAVKTQIDVEPAYDFELIGGWLDIPTSIKDGTTDQWYLAVVGVPDLSVAYGGSISFVSEVNLEAVPTQRLIVDGRATTKLVYSSSLHTSKMRFIIKHPVGDSKRFQLFLETFK